MNNSDIINLWNPEKTTGGLNPEIFSRWNDAALFIIKTRDIPWDDFHRYRSYLTPEENAKSLQFASEDDQQSYIILHGMLRQLLGRYTGILPDRIKFQYNQFGKPFLVGTEKSIFFNISHSSGISLLALDTNSRVGVDVEKINPNVDYNAIIRHCFTEKENSYINEFRDRSIQRFYRVWTRKEALLKALGIGIRELLNVEVLGKSIYHMNEPGSEYYTNEAYLVNTLTYRQEYVISIASNTPPEKINTIRIGK
jgi:phosphopantetheine--protein transferase-like protein